MSAWLRFLIGVVFFVAVMLVGEYVFHIRPTLAEMLLVVIAGGVSEGVREALS